MNKTKTIAYNWIKRHYKLKDKQILINQTPDFIIDDGRTFDAKLMYSNSIIFYKKQIDNMQDDTIIIIFRPGDVKPFMKVKWLDIKMLNIYQGIKIHNIMTLNNSDDLEISILLNHEQNKELKHYMAERNFEDKTKAIPKLLNEFFEIKEE